MGKAGITIDGLLISSSGPVRASFIPTPKALTVLYGVNGAGKSSLLRSLRACLTGEPNQKQATTLVVRVAESSDSLDLPDWLNQYLADWADHDEKHWEFGRDAGSIAMTAPPATLAQRAAMEALESAGESVDGHGDQFDSAGVTREQVAAEVVGQRIYLLREPRMTGEREMHLGALLTEDTPALNRALPADLIAPEGPDAFFDPTAGNHFPHLGNPGADPKPTYAGLYFSANTVQVGAIADVITSETPVLSLPRLLEILTHLGIPMMADDSADAGQRAAEVLGGIELHAQELLELVLIDAPSLRLYRGTPAEWLVHQAPAWRVATASGSATASSRSLDQLSDAQSKWAQLAINTAVTVALRNLVAAHRMPGMKQFSPTHGGELFIIIDEPEAHLHRSGEVHMARGLQTWSKRLDAHVVVASHSPELLDQPKNHLLHVAGSLGAESSQVRPLGAPTLATMHEFGIHASDLLRRQKAFLLVEGLHDQIVLEEVIGEELRTARVEVLPIRGAKQLPATVDSQFLFDFTDATVIVMLDAIEPGEVALAWDRARAMAQRGNTAAAGDALRAALAGNAAELRWMREFLSKSLERGVSDRLMPFGLEALDVVEYLPVHHLVPKAPSWEQLRRDHGASGTKKDFKTWLTLSAGADFSPEAVRHAARNLDRVPDEIVELANICLRLASR